MNQQQFFSEIFNKPMQNKSALDLFARDGKMATIDWGDFFPSITACDIRQDYLDEYRKGWPQARTLNIDTVDALRTGKLFTMLDGKKFDFVAVDNPLGCYGNNYYEHYDFLRYLPDFLANDGFLYLPVNLHPYAPKESANARDNYGMDMIKYKKWMKKRIDFYGQENLTIPEAIKFYLDYFEKLDCIFDLAKWHLRKSQIVGHPDHLLYLLLRRHQTA